MNVPTDFVDPLGLSVEEGDLPDSCSGDVPPEPPSGCDVSIGFKVVKLNSSSAVLPGIGKTYYHSYVLLRSSSFLPPIFFRGSPTHSNPVPNGWGPIVVGADFYRPGAIDFPKKGEAPHKFLSLGHFKHSCAHYELIMGDNAIRINGSKTDYRLQGPNSNSVTYTLLTTAGLKFSQAKINKLLGPNGRLPGWGTLL